MVDTVPQVVSRSGRSFLGFDVMGLRVVATQTFEVAGVEPLFEFILYLLLLLIIVNIVELLSKITAELLVLFIMRLVFDLRVGLLPKQCHGVVFKGETVPLSFFGLHFGFGLSDEL